MNETDAAPQQPEPGVTAGAILTSLPAVFTSADLAGAFNKAKVPKADREPLTDEIFSLVKLLPNTVTSEDGTPSGYRFRYDPPLAPAGAWVRVLPGYAGAVVVGDFGPITAEGHLAELTSEQRAVFEARDCPIEVITDGKMIAKLKAAAEKKAAQASKVRDRKADVLADIAAAGK